MRHIASISLLIFAIYPINTVKLHRNRRLEGYVISANRPPIPVPSSSSMWDSREEDEAELGICSLDQDPLVVQTIHGPVKGFTDQDAANSSLVDVFLGIPFAQPPIGQFRFEKPRPPMMGWEGILNATEQKPSCVPNAQSDWMADLLRQGTYSEDCLYLNIFAPHGANKKYANEKEEMFPVLVLIHGGAFMVGSSRQFMDHKEIGAKFVSQGIVVVSIQYRLGVLGFASTGDAFLPGNLGLWDQLAALQFINRNIKRFGGNPEEITLLGHSAGAGSVAALAASPHSRHLFKRAVQMSGSGYASWMLGAQVPDLTIELAHQLGCPSYPAVKECLRRKTVEELFAAVERMGPARAKFGPRIDGDFLPQDIPTLVNSSPAKPTLIGMTDLEALTFTILFGQNSTINSFAIPWAEVDTYGPEQFEAFLARNVARKDLFGSRASLVQRDILDFYTKSSAAQAYASNVFQIRQYTQLLSDLMFGMAILNEVQHKSARAWPIHLYVHGYVNDQAFPQQVPIHESFHGNDFFNLFYGDIMHQFPPSDEDKQMASFMAEAIRNFVKTGNPSTSESFRLRWPRVSCPFQLEHIRIVSPPVVQSKLGPDLARRVLFWQRMAKKYPDFDLIRERTNPLL